MQGAINSFMTGTLGKSASDVAAQWFAFGATGLGGNSVLNACHVLFRSNIHICIIMFMWVIVTQLATVTGSSLFGGFEIASYSAAAGLPASMRLSPAQVFEVFLAVTQNVS